MGSPLVMPWHTGFVTPAGHAIKALEHIGGPQEPSPEWNITGRLMVSTWSRGAAVQGNNTHNIGSYTKAQHSPRGPLDPPSKGLVDIARAVVRRRRRSYYPRRRWPGWWYAGRWCSGRRVVIIWGGGGQDGCARAGAFLGSTIMARVGPPLEPSDLRISVVQSGGHVACGEQNAPQI